MHFRTLAFSIVTILLLATAASAQEQQQRAGQALLREVSREAPKVRFLEGQAVMVSARVPVGRVGGTSDPVDAAIAYLNYFHELYLLDTGSLYVERLASDQLGQHVFFGQRNGEVRLMGAQLVVHISNSGEVLGSSGRYLPAAPVWTGSAFTAETALATALTQSRLGDARAIGSARPMTFNPSLLFKNAELRMYRLEKRTYSTWVVTITGNRSTGGVAGLTYILDNDTGATLLVRDRAESVGGAPSLWVNETTSSTRFICAFPGSVTWFTEAGMAPGVTPDAEGVTAFAAERTYADFLWGQFSRDSYDAKGGQLRVILDYPVSSSPNAQWEPWCQHAVFDNNMATSDVVFHELTHGLVEQTAGLKGGLQPDTLNESYADIFAAFNDRANWTIGEGSALGAIRSLSKPTVFGDPDKMSNFMITTDPHRNAGITNKAAFLIVMGGSHNSVTVKGIGYDKAQQLYFQTLSTMLTSNADFAVHALATILVAKNFAGSGLHGFTASDACQVNNAFAAVELAQEDLDCDGLPDVIDPDDDADGIADAIDNCVRDYNPGQGNLDGDSTGDVCDVDKDGDLWINTADNCPSVPNTNQANTGGTSMGDACEDTDLDGVLDLTDNCKTTANTNQKNDDGDAFGNACDADLDNDGVTNLQDNCSLVANSTQADADFDGMGDACDLCPTTVGGVDDLDHDGLGDECDGDIDGDQVLNAQDNCPRVGNGIQLDSDHDGVGDACDPSSSYAGGLSQELILKARGQAFERFSTTLNPCLTFSCPTRPSLTLKTTLKLEFSTPMYAQIVDSDGQVLAYAAPSTQVTLTFAPKTSFNFSRAGGDADPGFAKIYTLETYPVAGRGRPTDYRMLMTGFSGEW